MRCVLVEPGSSDSKLIVEKHCLASDMAAVNDPPSKTEGVFLHPDVCDARAASSSPPPEDTTCDDSQMPQWLKRRDTSPAKSDFMENGIHLWSYPLASLSPQGDGFQPHRETQSPSSALQGRSPPIHSESQSFISEYPHDFTFTAASEPDATSIKGEGFDSDDPASGLVHPVPRPLSLYIASRNMALFPDFKMELASTSLFDPPVESNEECLIDPGVVPKPDWTFDDLEPAPLFDESPPRLINSFVDTSLISMDQASSPDSSLSWSSLGHQTTFGMQHQGISPNEALYPNGPELFNINGQYGHLNAGFDQTTTTSNDFHGLTLLNNESHSYLQPQAHLNPCRSDDPNLATNPNTVVINGNHEPFYVTADTSAYPESLFQLNQLTHPRFTIDTRHCRQQILGNRTFSCPTDTRNAFLIECKRRGLSYKKIKRLGGFKEAESTLRGRFRTLTKSKDQRVRRPHWHDKDIKLLCEAVTACSETRKRCRHSHNSNKRPSVITEPPKVPWKKVAQYIWVHGGSYHFGNATCKKKWCEVHNVRT